MKKRLVIKVMVPFLALVLFSACATPQKVNIKAVETNKNKTFKFGMVKVEGHLPVPGHNLEKKKMALERIPLKEICDLLSRNYGLKFSAEIDRTIKTVKESKGTGVISEDPYRGLKEYTEPSLLEGMLLHEGPTIKDVDVGDMVYITYGQKQVGGLPWSFKDEFYYSIIVKSDAIVLIDLRGTVAVVDTPKKGLFLDSEGIWDNLVFYADKIPEALAKDIDKTK